MTCFASRSSMMYLMYLMYVLVHVSGKSLLWVFFYGLVLIYIYTLIAFALYRVVFNADTGHYCTSMYECFVTAVHRGLLDGLYNVSAAVKPTHISTSPASGI